MKTTNVLWIVLDLIFLIVFNVLFFVLGGTVHNISVWMSYCFIHFSYIMLILTPLITRRGRSKAVFGVTLYSISAVYFIISLITGIIFILLAMEEYTVSLLVQLCIVGLYGIILISNIMANGRTTDAEEKRSYEIAYIKEASAKLKGMLDNMSDREIRKKIEIAYDAVNSSPVKSHPNVTQIEDQVLQSIYELEDEITAGNNDNIVTITNSLLKAVNDRNMQLKLISE